MLLFESSEQLERYMTDNCYKICQHLKKSVVPQELNRSFGLYMIAERLEHYRFVAQSACCMIVSQ